MNQGETTPYTNNTRKAASQNNRNSSDDSEGLNNLTPTMHNVSPMTNITDKMTLGVNLPVVNLQQMQQRLSFPGQENLQMAKKNMLFEFKSRLENVEVEFDEAKQEIERLKKRKGELEAQE